MEYRETVTATSKLINKFLRNEVHQGEDETISKTIVFKDGMEMDVKCCGVKDENEGSWTEAVLFRNGSEVCCSEPDTEFFGEWRLEYNGNEYIAEVLPA